MKHLRVLAAAALLPCASCHEPRQPREPQQPAQVAFTDAFPAQADFERPLFLAYDEDDPAHYWVVEQTGRILRIPRDGDDGARQVVLDWSERCLHPSNGGHNEEGLLGFAFDPEWGTANHHVYIYYSHRVGGEGQGLVRESIVSRLTTTDDGGAVTADPISELVLLRVPQPWGNHNGGTIVFGPDRMLYIALGDGGAANDQAGNGQNLGTLLAAVLRIDVRDATAEAPYRVPGDNPFVGREGARPEIWAWGLRNPWRIAFDRETGDLWCGDVGQNLWEEVDRLIAGGNYGWPLMEGTHTFPPDTKRTAEELAGLIPPVAEYGRNVGISVTGGYVYRGKALPDLRGRYVYADWTTRRLFAVREDREGGDHDVLALGVTPGMPMSFAEELDGELLVLGMEGRIHRMVPRSE
jgi:glucose/arabinose dehydrogenase